MTFRYSIIAVVSLFPFLSLADGRTPSPSSPAYNTLALLPYFVYKLTLSVPWFDAYSSFKGICIPSKLGIDPSASLVFGIIYYSHWKFEQVLYDGSSFYTIGTRESHAPEIWAYFMHNVIESEWLDRVGEVVCHPQFRLPLVPSWWQRRYFKFGWNLPAAQHTCPIRLFSIYKEVNAVLYQYL